MVEYSEAGTNISGACRMCLYDLVDDNIGFKRGLQRPIWGDVFRSLCNPDNIQSTFSDKYCWEF